MAAVLAVMRRCLKGHNVDVFLPMDFMDFRARGYRATTKGKAWLKRAQDLGLGRSALKRR